MTFHMGVGLRREELDTDWHCWLSPWISTDQSHGGRSGPRTPVLICPILVFVCLADLLNSLRFTALCMEAGDSWEGMPFHLTRSASCFPSSHVSNFSPERLGQHSTQRTGEGGRKPQLCSRLWSKMMLRLYVKQVLKTKGKIFAREE